MFAWLSGVSPYQSHLLSLPRLCTLYQIYMIWHQYQANMVVSNNINRGFKPSLQKHLGDIIFCPETQRHLALEHRFYGKPTTQRVRHWCTLIWSNATWNSWVLYHCSCYHLSINTMQHAGCLPSWHTGIPPCCVDWCVSFLGCAMNFWYETRGNSAQSSWHVTLPPLSH